MWQDDASSISDLDMGTVTATTEISPMLRLPGEHNRKNATLILKALEVFKLPAKYAADGLNKFPGTHRRFESLGANLYSDYGHTPMEIKATLQMAKELSDKVVLVYQPHQNRRQFHIRDEYTNEIFTNADKVLWLPTYLSREDESQAILTPKDLTSNLAASKVDIVSMDDDLYARIESLRSDGNLVLCMGAGDIDSWVRSNL